MAHNNNIIITIRSINGDIVAIDQIPVATDELVAEVEFVYASPCPRRAERNPLHPRALILDEIRANMRIRVHYTGLRMDIKDFSAIVTKNPFANDEGDFIVPFIEEDGNQSQWLAADMGLTPYGENWDSPVTWTPLWYVTAE